MKFIPRTIKQRCQRDLESFPILTITGPRQSGKSTLLQNLFPNWKYANLEDPSISDFAKEDPKGFLNTYNNHVIFDEIQRVPSLLSYLQVEIDKDRKPGRFAISGSNNLLLLEHVSQSLAGRTSVRHLLPFSYEELREGHKSQTELNSALFYGGYPAVHEHLGNAHSWLDSYTQTYIERDVRLIRNVNDLGTFRRFLRLCAGRVGQLLDLSGIGNDAGISHNTTRDWVNVLEAGFIAFRLEPYFKNFSKRIIKSPKLYFYDTGVLCRLLDIRSPEDLTIHPFRGAIFENWCIVEALKRQFAYGTTQNIYFWRDQTIEVDILVKFESSKLFVVECKSSATSNASFIDNAMAFKKFAKGEDVIPTVVYGGDFSQSRHAGTFLGWQDFSSNLYKWS